MTDDAQMRNTRRTMRLTTSFLLQSLALLRRATGLEMLTAIIFMHILDANTEVVSEISESEGRFVELDDVPGDELREPVSVYNLAHELGMPYETVRRHVQLLIERGYAQRIGNRGVIIPREVLAQPAMFKAVDASAAQADNYVMAYLEQPGHPVEGRVKTPGDRTRLVGV